MEEIYFNRVHAKSVCNPLPFHPGRCFLRIAVSLLWSSGVMFCSLSVSLALSVVVPISILRGKPCSNMKASCRSLPLDHSHVLYARISLPARQSNSSRQALCQTVYSLPSLSPLAFPSPPPSLSIAMKPSVRNSSLTPLLQLQSSPPASSMKL